MFSKLSLAAEPDLQTNAYMGAPTRNGRTQGSSGHQGAWRIGTMAPLASAIGVFVDPSVPPPPPWEPCGLPRGSTQLPTRGWGQHPSGPLLSQALPEVQGFPPPRRRSVSSAAETSLQNVGEGSAGDLARTQVSTVGGLATFESGSDLSRPFESCALKSGARPLAPLGSLKPSGFTRPLKCREPRVSSTPAALPTSGISRTPSSHTTPRVPRAARVPRARQISRTLQLLTPLRSSALPRIPRPRAPLGSRAPPSNLAPLGSRAPPQISRPLRAALGPRTPCPRAHVPRAVPAGIGAHGSLRGGRVPPPAPTAPAHRLTSRGPGCRRARPSPCPPWRTCCSEPPPPPPPPPPGPTPVRRHRGPR